MNARTTPRRPVALNVETLEGRDLPASLIPGGIVQGAIAQSGEVDSWTFTGKPGDRIELISTSTPTQAGFDAFAEVYAPSGERVTWFWAGTNVALSLSEFGTHRVEVRDGNYAETGEYTIGLEGLSPISPDPGLLVKGGIRGGVIEAPTEKDQWTFAGVAGQRVELISTSTPTQAGFDAFVEVYAPSGTRETWFWAGTNVVLDVEETGTYMLQVRDGNYQERGAYTIGLEGLLPISPGPSPLVKGGIVNGKIEAPVEKDQWTFTGVAGDLVELISTSTPTQAGFDAFAEVYGPSGERVTWFWAGTNVALDLPETGAYMVQVRDGNYAETGEYTIGLEGRNPISPAPGAIKKGGIVSGEIGARIEKDQWTFGGVAGQRVELISTSTATRSGFNAFVEVYGPSGERVTWFWANSNTAFDLPETGTYMVQVRDDNFAETGKYTIGFESLNPRSPDAKALPRNVQVTGSIGTATKKDQWFIRVPEGKRLRLILAGTAVTPGFQVFANVFDSSGTRVGGMWAGNQVFTLEAGVYLIQVNDAALTKRGTYRLTGRIV